MATKLYVGNLAYGTMEDELRTLFGKAGDVVGCDLVLDRVTRKSRGFAFVEMSSQEEADEAVKQFNEYDLDGRRLVVNEARPREFRGAGGFPDQGHGGGKQGGRRKSGKGSRRGARSAKRDAKGFW